MISDSVQERRSGGVDSSPGGLNTPGARTSSVLPDLLPQVSYIVSSLLFHYYYLLVFRYLTLFSILTLLLSVVVWF